MSRKPTSYHALLTSHLLTGRITRAEYVEAYNEEILVQKGHMLRPDYHGPRLVKLYPNRAAILRAMEAEGR